MEHASLNGRQRRKALAMILAALAVAACEDDQLPRVGLTATAPVTPTYTPPTAAPATVAPASSTSAPAATPPATASLAAPPPVAAAPPPAPAPDSLPQISGSPKTEAEADAAYSFIPTASDADGDALSFTIANRPSWLSFASATGALTGTPTAAQVGVYRNITIQVAAGGKYDTLPAFDIEVVAVGQKGVTLSWAAPTQNADGSALTNLAGYKIRYGETSGTYTTTISLTNPGLSSHFIDGLVPSTYYFVISSFNSQGIESTYSNEAVKTI